MTDQELKDLVAGLAISQAKTDEELRKLALSQAKTDEELRKLALSQAKTDEELRKLALSQDKTDEQMKQTDEQLKRTDEQLKRTDEKLERIGITLGNIGNNQGAVAEEFFYNSLKYTQMLGGIHYDIVYKNMSASSNKIEDEYDIVMINGKDIAIIEVKYKANESDLEKLLTKKHENFNKLFPIYKDYTHHLVLATFALYDDLKSKALSSGVMVLQRKGDTIESFLPAA